MPRSVTNRGSSSRSYSAEEFQLTDSSPVRPGAGEGAAGRAEPGRPGSTRNGPKQWSWTVVSVLSSASAVAAVGCFCALVYPILRELRAERVRGEDGTEQRMLGFWSILVLSLLGGCICCVCSCVLTYQDLQTGRDFSSLLTQENIRDVSARGFHMGYAVAALNGVMAMLTVVWSLT